MMYRLTNLKNENGSSRWWGIDWIDLAQNNEK
jgi:hypothetical protein